MSYINDLFSLNDQVAVVTGAARGNGYTMAEALLRAGSRVILCDILNGELKKATQDFLAQELKAEMYLCDLADPQQIRGFIEWITAEHGTLNTLVNNAGVTLPRQLFDYKEADWDKTLQINLTAPFLLSQGLAKLMTSQKSGSIINITSINAETGFPDNPAYMASKGALKQLSKSLAFDLGCYGIRVNSVGPGYFKTDMTKDSYNDPIKHQERRDSTLLGRWGEPHDLAGVIIFLASKASSYITGQDFYVDGGWLAKGL